MINAARENYFLLGSDYRLMRAGMLSYMDHYGNRIIPYGVFNNIPNPATINVTKIRHENERALWIKENEEYFKTVMKRIREFEHVNQRYFTYDDFHFLDNIGCNFWFMMFNDSIITNYLCKLLHQIMFSDMFL